MSNAIKQPISKMAQTWANKRLAVFKKLKTDPHAWHMAQLKDFKPRERTTKKGEIVIDWLPVYKIPDGYVNHFGSDDDQSAHKKCQLCEKDICFHGVILHEESKQFLIVGDSCLDKYETDDDKQMKLDLMVQLKDRYEFDRLNGEKKRLTELVEAKAKEQKLPLDFYAICVKNRYLAWGKVKFANFLANWGNTLAMIGYEPDLYIMGINGHKKNLKNRILSVFGFRAAICRKYDTNFDTLRWREGFKKECQDGEHTVWNQVQEIQKKIGTLNLHELREWAKGCDALRTKWFTIPVDEPSEDGNHWNARKAWKDDKFLGAIRKRPNYWEKYK